MSADGRTGMQKQIELLLAPSLGPADAFKAADLIHDLCRATAVDMARSILSERPQPSAPERPFDRVWPLSGSGSAPRESDPADYVPSGEAFTPLGIGTMSWRRHGESDPSALSSGERETGNAACPSASLHPQGASADHGAEHRDRSQRVTGSAGVSETGSSAEGEKPVPCSQPVGSHVERAEDNEVARPSSGGVPDQQSDDAARSARFNNTTGAISWRRRSAAEHPDRCVCQGDESTPHKHYDSAPFECARCLCEAYRPHDAPAPAEAASEGRELDDDELEHIGREAWDRVGGADVKEANRYERRALYEAGRASLAKRIEELEAQLREESQAFETLEHECVREKQAREAYERFVEWFQQRCSVRLSPNDILGRIADLKRELGKGA